MCPLESQAHNYSFFLSVSGISGSTQKHESSSLWMLPSPTAPPEALPLELFLGIQRSQQREVKKNIAATFCARKGWVLAVGFSYLLSLQSSLCLIPTGVAISQHAYHWSSESPHSLAALCQASVHNDASFPSSPEVLPATFTFSWVLERGLSTLDFIRIENQAGRHLWFVWYALQSDSFLARKYWQSLVRAKIGETEHLAVTFCIFFNIDALSFYKMPLPCLFPGNCIKPEITWYKAMGFSFLK